MDAVIGWWLLLLFLAGPVGWVASLIRRDHNRADAAEARAAVLAVRVTYWTERAAAAEQTLAETRAQWCADSDEWAIREVEHRAVCLGERVIPLERCS